MEKDPNGGNKSRVMRIGDIFRFENLFTSAATREKFRSKYVENLIKIFVYGD